MKLKTLQWRSPITTISLLSVLGGVTYMIAPMIVQYGMSTYPVSIEHRILQFIGYSFIHG